MAGGQNLPLEQGSRRKPGEPWGIKQLKQMNIMAKIDETVKLKESSEKVHHQSVSVVLPSLFSRL